MPVRACTELRWHHKRSFPSRQLSNAFGEAFATPTRQHILFSTPGRNMEPVEVEILSDRDPG